MAAKSKNEILAIARDKCGFDTLRPGQEEAIRGVLDTRDTLVVQPTGAGKSAIYQIAGLLIEGTTIVVSPLIALQKDQVRAINDADLAETAVVNSTARVGEVRDAFERMKEGDVEYVFLSPEQLQKPDVLDKVKASGPSLFVVDEAHCISEWGHDFRPDYLRLGPVIEALGHPTVLAMTATASAAVREDIITHLGLRNPAVIVKGFDRPNISLAVKTFDTEAKKVAALLDDIEAAEKPGIVYVSTRRHAEQIAGALEDRNVSVVFYHGGMRGKDREAVQNGYMGGDAQVIIATNAFGMGVDKPDVRFVFHGDVSDSLDSYYQEIGRAGRDGLPAKAVLYYRPQNANLHRFLKGGGRSDRQEFERVVEAARSSEKPNVEAIRKLTGLSERKVVKAINRLVEVGALKRSKRGQLSVPPQETELAKVIDAAVNEQEKHRDADRLRIEKMQAYAEMRSCRREYILHYFGEDVPARCENCDNCRNPRAAEPPVTADRDATAPGSRKQPLPDNVPYPEKTRVVHKELGKGIVESFEADKITILFDEGGRKTLSLDVVQAQGLLQRAA